MIHFYRSEVTKHLSLTPKFHHIHLKLLDDKFSFKPGQFVVVKVGDSIYRSYSVASVPAKMPDWEVVVNIEPGGPGTTYLKSLKVGDIIETTNPRGIFTLKVDSEKTVILGATGCGIASIKPMAEDLLASGKQEVYLFWGLRYEEDLFFQDILTGWQKKYPHFHSKIILSKPEGNWPGSKGHITEHITDFIRNADSDKISVYLCGNGEMIADIVRSCTDLNFPCDKIYFEKYA